jgi:hypothetical protein
VSASCDRLDPQLVQVEGVLAEHRVEEQQPEQAGDQQGHHGDGEGPRVSAATARTGTTVRTARRRGAAAGSGEPVSSWATLMRPTGPARRHAAAPTPPRVGGHLVGGGLAGPWTSSRSSGTAPSGTNGRSTGTVDAERATSSDFTILSSSDW